MVFLTSQVCLSTLSHSDTCFSSTLMAFSILLKSVLLRWDNASWFVWLLEMFNSKCMSINDQPPMLKLDDIYSTYTMSGPCTGDTLKPCYWHHTSRDDTTHYIQRPRITSLCIVSTCGSIHSRNTGPKTTISTQFAAPTKTRGLGRRNTCWGMTSRRLTEPMALISPVQRCPISVSWGGGLAMFWTWWFSCGCMWMTAS